ncbi:MAG: hypothetical protein DSY50_06275 [Desulfobulbus sp.]|nr:MAG: hypothetical protein DSY50_06275 [Desulfobulbus sp.]
MLFRQKYTKNFVTLHEHLIFVHLSLLDQHKYASKVFKRTGTHDSESGVLEQLQSGGFAGFQHHLKSSEFLQKKRWQVPSVSIFH